MFSRIVHIILLLATIQYGAFAQQNPVEYYHKGYEAASKNNYQEAISLYSQSIQLDPDYLDAYYNRGWCYVNVGAYQEAIRDFSRIIEVNKTYQAAHLSRGLARFSLGDYENAIQDYLLETKTDKNCKLCYNNIGVAKEKLNQFEDALIYYGKALEIDTNYQTAKKNKDKLQRLLSKVEADKQTNQTNSANNAFVSAKEYFNMGYAANEQSNYEKAIEYFSKALEIDPTYRLAYENRAWAKKYLARYQEAIEDYNKALELGISKWTYNQRGDAYFKLKKFQEAIDDFDKAIGIDSTYANAIMGRKQALKFLQEKSNATDKTPPKVVITSPDLSTNRGLGVVRLDQNITITGVAQDESGVVAVIVNGNNANLQNSGDFDIQLPLAVGKNQVILYATDTKGNKAEYQFVIERAEQSVQNANPTSPETEKKLFNGKSYALLIATDEYDEWEKLNNPTHDAQTIAQELKDYYNFETELLLNPRKDQLMLKLKEYARRNYEPNDQLFIFIAGHGHFDEVFQEGFIVTKDSKKDDDGVTSYLSHSNLRTVVNNIKAKHIFLVMDVCFGGTFDPIIARRGGETDNNQISKAEFVARKMRFKTRRYLSSGGKEYVPDGRAGQHSPFARKVLEALRSYGGNDGILTINEIISQVEALQPEPRSGEFGDNEPGSDFIFIAK